jgi:hypothetical protein
MEAEDGLYSVKGTCGDHRGSPAGRDLLGRLTEKNDPAAELGLPGYKHFNRAHERGHVAVVSAGVAGIREFGKIFFFAFLQERKSVHVGPQGYGPSSGETFQIGPKSCSRKRSDGKPQALKKRPQNSRRFDFLMSRFGTAVESAAPIGQSSDQGGGIFFNIVEHPPPPMGKESNLPENGSEIMAGNRRGDHP